MFDGKPTGEVASFRVDNGNLHPISAENSAGVGTCHVAVDPTSQMLISADYVGGSAASFKITDGELSKAVWTETYTYHGPNTARQNTAHAHFASFSPDNRFAYINDLGGDCIHIYKPDPATAAMTPAGTYERRAGLRSANAALPSQRPHRLLHERTRLHSRHPRVEQDRWKPHSR